MTNDGTDIVKSNYPSLGLGNSFAFKFEDLKGRMHRLNFGKLCKLEKGLQITLDINLFICFHTLSVYLRVTD